MKIDIQSQGIPVTSDVRDHTVRRLSFALARAAARVRRVKVQVSDVNGPRGGIDKRCRIQASLDGIGDIVIEDTEANLFQAISRAADRVGRNVMRRLERGSARARTRLRRGLTVEAAAPQIG